MASELLRIWGVSNMRDLTHMSLFTGIGGLDIAAEMAGFVTVGQCELADYPYRVLCKHWPRVLKWRDIRTLTGESFYEYTGLRTVSVLSGGVPCQPFSLAGKRLGQQDERYLWPEMLRVIRELMPSWAIVENVPGILRLAGNTVCQDLERAGFDVGIFNFEAAAVGAPHRRERVFFVANTRSRRRGEQDICGQQPGRTEAISAGEVVGHTKHDGPLTGEVKRINTKNACESRKRPEQAIESERTSRRKLDAVVADATSKRLERATGTKLQGDLNRFATRGENAPSSDPYCIHRDARRPEPAGQQRKAGSANGGDVFDALRRGCEGNEWWEHDKEFEIRRWWTTEPDVGRVAHGVPNRVDRLKCLGNAVVPMQAYPIFAAIAGIERERQTAQNVL